MKKNNSLSPEELQLAAAFKNDEFISVKSPQLVTHYQAVAKRTLKNKNINIRLSEEVLSKLKVKADKAGLPYQTLISSVLHRYAQQASL